MKRIKYILILTIISFIVISCHKSEPPSPDYYGYGVPAHYTNKYILENICVYNFRDDTVWRDINYYIIESHKIEDTVKHSDLYLKIDLAGLLISENIYFTGSTSIEQEYFINKIKDYKIYANNININSKVNFLKKDKKEVYTASNIVNEELGYSPLKIELTDTLNISEKVIFKIIFTDDNNNIFTSQTDSIFILNE